MIKFSIILYLSLFLFLFISITIATNNANEEFPYSSSINSPGTQDQVDSPIIYSMGYIWQNTTLKANTPVASFDLSSDECFAAESSFCRFMAARYLGHPVFHANCAIGGCRFTYWINFVSVTGEAELVAVQANLGFRFAACTLGCNPSTWQLFEPSLDPMVARR